MFLVPYFVIRTPIGEKRETNITNIWSQVYPVIFSRIKKKITNFAFPVQISMSVTVSGAGLQRGGRREGGWLTFLSFLLSKIKDGWGTRLPYISTKTPVKCQFSRKTPGNCQNSRNSYFQIFASFCTLSWTEKCTENFSDNF